MPYINQDNRKKLDDLIDDLSIQIKKIPDFKNNRDGCMNYCFTRLIREVYGAKEKVKIGNTIHISPMRFRYKDINALMGMLSCVGREFYRRWAAPYEDEKIKQNGDVK